MFWAIDMILTNCWKIYESLYGPFLSSNNIRRRNIHREFLEALVELLFLCDSETYAEMVPGTSFKEYPKYDYSPHKSGPKPRSSEPIPLNLTDISRETPFIFKGDPGRPKVSIPAKITPISRHQHIKTTTRGWCLICRNSNETEKIRMAKEERLVYGPILKGLEKTLEEVNPLKRDKKEPKRIRGTSTFWKCSECAVPICRPGKPCWDIAHKRLFSC
jgi:hypothetical protein